ncbi:colorectal cancer-associated protein 2 [Sphaerodactylus townsendi]|uniref:colorectal cancer-associated protein 2 n=1 Tax=Sphaerodactylus townsendi TaxID=933632 RepID=UPI002025FDF2|nr:colorectal cancer-associated protein 2 [Sphaerodactylus townsendi]XP_048369033.1 colorectal cancer-associated protein 2 [Sphaerodactylus townsendi]
MSGKPKIYQGVRVKITVKELLQQRRAKQAVPEEAVSSDGSVQLTEAFSPPCPGAYVDSVSSSSSGCVQPWQFQSCTSCEEIPSFLEQLVDSCLQTEMPFDTSTGAAQDSLHGFPDIFQPDSACLNQSLGHASLDSSDPSSSFDCSYSPPQLPSFTPLGYNSSPCLDVKSCMFPSSEGSPYPQPPHTHYNHTSSTCCCTSCGSQRLDAFRVPEYFPYASTDCRDCTPSLSVADDFFRMDRAWDTCYS